MTKKRNAQDELAPCDRLGLSSSQCSRPSSRIMCYAQRPQAGRGGWGAPREAPRCPRVPGCLPGALPGRRSPRASRAGGTAQGVPVTSGRFQAAFILGCAQVRPENESFVRFMIFGLFSLIFACCISDFACFGSFFSTNVPMCPRLGLPLGSRCPRSAPTSGGRACRHARGDRHLGHHDDASWRSRGAPHPPPSLGCCA